MPFRAPRNSASSSPTAPARTPGALERLAWRISSWTSKGILTMLVLLAGWAFGCQVLRWWAEAPEPDAPPSPLAAAGALDYPALPSDLEFGEGQWAFTHQTLAAEPEQVLAALRAAARQALLQAAVPLDVPSPAEERFVQSLTPRQPVEQQPGQWCIYALSEAFPLVVGLHAATADAPRKPDEVVPLGYRVVSWGMAVPVGARTWTLFTFHPPLVPQALGSATDAIPLPPNSRRLVSLRARGGAVVAFQGEAGPETWQRFFDRCLPEHGWQPTGAWRQSGASWHLRCRASQGNALLDVRFGPDQRGQHTGILILTSTSAAESEHS